MAYEYVGIGRTKKFKWGDVVELSFSEKDIEKLTHYLYKGWVRVTVTKRKNADGDVTHYGKIWYPDTVAAGREEVGSEGECGMENKMNDSDNISGQPRLAGNKKEV